MKRLPSVPNLREGASFTELVRRTARLHRLSEIGAAHAVGLDSLPRGGPSAFDVVGFAPDQAQRLTAATGMDTYRIASMTISAAFPAFSRLSQSGRENHRRGKYWDSIGLHRTDAPACETCTVQDPDAFPLAWRIHLLPACLRHAVYLSAKCKRCNRFPGRPARTKNNHDSYCRSGCVKAEPQPASRAVLEAQLRLSRLMSAQTPDDTRLRATLDFAWYLNYQVGAGKRAKADVPDPDELGKILLLATGWSTQIPVDVATQPEFRSVPTRTLQYHRPFASAPLRTAFLFKPRTLSSAPPPRLTRAATSRVDQPHYLPIDLHIQYTSDLVHDGWVRKTAPTLRASRRIAAQAANSNAHNSSSPAVVAVAAVAQRLQERGQLEKWLAALQDVRDDLARTPRLFGATWDDIDTFAENFHQDSNASYPTDAAIIWFLRDHRCVNYIERLGWPVSRRKSASATEGHARRNATCGPWDVIQERLTHAAHAADNAYQRDAQTA